MVLCPELGHHADSIRGLPMNMNTLTVEELLGPLNEVEKKNAPKKLFVAGNPSVVHSGARVSIVGSRKASRRGTREILTATARRPTLLHTTMASRASRDAAAAFEQAERKDPTRRIAVIITMRDWARRGDVVRAGLAVDHEAEHGKIITGTVTGETGRRVAELDSSSYMAAPPGRLPDE